MSSINPPTLAYPSPSPSSGTASLVDYEYVTANEWSSATSSRASSPLNKAAAMPPPLPPPATKSPLLEPLSLPSDETRWLPPADFVPSPKKLSRPEYTSSKKRHVPRPPNAFMLFRSQMVNTRIPKIANRQQNISRVAGQIWNQLSDKTKQVWHDKAEEFQRDHKLKYPDYKFTPRKAAMKADEGGDGEVRNAEDYVRHLREKYMGVMGPAVPPARKRKPRSRAVRTEEEDLVSSLKHIRARLATFDPLPLPLPLPSPPRTVTSTSSTPSMNAVASAAALPPWRSLSQTYASMPSTYDYLLLADEYSKIAGSSYLPVPLQHETMVSDRGDSRRRYVPFFDIDKTPANFGHMPASSAYPTIPGSFGTFQHNMLGLADLALPQTNFYSSFYSGTPTFLENTHTPVPSPSEGPVPDFTQFAFSDDIFTSIASCSGSDSSASSASVINEPKPIAIPSPPLASITVSRVSTPEENEATTTTC